ncbi:MAG TPA: septal ring lytic transglycosylase RlpA family protein [Candidatus Tectomicrobia bacterium]|nr:septal ring lytic transglycosylase RlpA family protein [Candidatus Tectomicrobia bacterium]
MAPRTLLLAAPIILALAACAGPRAVTRPDGGSATAPAPGAGGRVAPAPIGTEERGLASWYGEPYHGRQAASGEVFDMHLMTAAHRTLPFGTWLRVENLDSGRAAEVRVNDRGPFVDGRVLDVSYAAGVALGLIGPGVAPVRLRVIPPPSPAGTAGIGETSAPVSTARAGEKPSSATMARAAEAPAAEPPSAAVPETPVAPRFAVQVGAFAEEARALLLQRALANAGFEGRVLRGTAGDRALYRVRLGPFTTRAEAEAETARLEEIGHRGVIVAE